MVMKEEKYRDEIIRAYDYLAGELSNNIDDQSR